MVQAGSKLRHPEPKIGYDFSLVGSVYRDGLNGQDQAFVGFAISARYNGIVGIKVNTGIEDLGAILLLPVQPKPDLLVFHVHWPEPQHLAVWKLYRVLLLYR